jgi:hypothetical protein
MEDRHIPPDEVSVNTILNYCKQTANVVGALEVLRCIPPSSNFVPDEMTYHVLFEMAWRTKSFNLAKVVWRYACLNATTTSWMRNRVVVSLKNSIRMRGSDLSPRQFFQKAAGVFITAIRHHQEHPVWVFQKEFKGIAGFEASTFCPVDKEVYAIYSDAFDGTDFGNTPTSNKSDGEDSGGETKMPKSPDLGINSDTEKYNGYYKFLGHDCDVFQWWKPIRPMVEMLSEAWGLDQEWIHDHEKGAVRDKIDWRLDNAITIPLRATINQRRVTMKWK